MKLSILIGLVALSASAQDITFTNKTATFTNLEGRVYERVELVKADLDGLIWRDDSGGMALVLARNNTEAGQED